MVSPFLTRFRTGNATKPYPAEPEPAPQAFRGQLVLDPARCQADAACVAACPSSAISVERTANGWVWELTDARCVFCGLCVDACPSSAISVTQEFELATRNAADLVTRISIEEARR